MNAETRAAAQAALDDTMTVSQAKQRKLDLRQKELELRQATEKRKGEESAARERRRQEREARAADRRAEQTKNREDREKQRKIDAENKAKEAKDAKGTQAVINSKRRREAAEKKKLDRVTAIAAKKKAGIQKSMDRAKQVGPGPLEKVTKDQGDASALASLGTNVAKSGVSAGRVGFNLGKAAAKSVASIPARMKAAKLQKKADAKERKIEKRNDAIEKARQNRVKARLKSRREFRRGRVNEDFLSEVDNVSKKDSKEKKVDKIIDIMKGKNKIEIAPKISEEVTGGILVQDIKDYKPLEIETVDIIKPEPLKVEEGVLDAALKTDKKMGELHKKVDNDVKRMKAGKKFKEEVEQVNEEDSDRLKDRRMERGGVGGNQRYDRAPKAPNTKKFGSGKTMAQKEMEKKYGKGATAMDIVKAQIRAKHGKGAIKEGHHNWRADLDEMISTSMSGRKYRSIDNPTDQKRIRKEKESTKLAKKVADDKKRDELAKTKREKGIKFYDKKGSGYIKGGVKTYD